MFAPAPRRRCRLPLLGMSRLRDARRWARSGGWRDVCRLGAGLAASKAAGRGHRMHVRPNLDEMLVGGGGRFLFDAEQLLVELGWDVENVRALRPEFDEVLARLDARYDQCAGVLPFPGTTRI